MLLLHEQKANETPMNSISFIPIMNQLKKTCEEEGDVFAEVRHKFNIEIDVNVLTYPLSHKSNPHVDIT